jgi:hypothetical protein
MAWPCHFHPSGNNQQSDDGQKTEIKVEAAVAVDLSCSRIITGALDFYS